MFDINTRLVALQHARDWSADADEIERLDEEIAKLQAERRSTARAMPDFTTR